MQVTEIKSLIGKIARSAAKLATMVQQAALESLIHAVLHGDVSLANMLIDATGKGTRKATLYAWLELNGPFYLPKGKTLLAFDKDRAAALREEGEAAIRERLEEVLWVDAKPEPKPVSVFDAVAEFDKFLNRLVKLSKEPEIQLKHREFLDALEQFSVKYNNEAVIKGITALEPEEMEKIYGLKKVEKTA